MGRPGRAGIAGLTGVPPALARARVARLATADGRGRPHVVPVCFAAAGSRLYSAIDEKPKRAAPPRLKRVRNITANPHVALVVDDYREDWRRLWFVLVFGTAEVIGPGAPEHAAALRALRRKYPQYRTMRLEDRPVLGITPARIVTWPRRGRTRAR
ncbi:MAG TPA: TIGR03668 family PPOX class F420-dependent oxidoreductase [bacterium]|nr:TIGR03668 family PPOX class F420-dependent oxidoreductase [bacterium]